MAEGRIKDSELSAIAAAIRSKNGESTVYKPAEMAAAIEAIPSGGGGLPLGIAVGSYELANIGMSWSNSAEESVS